MILFAVALLPEWGQAFNRRAVNIPYYAATSWTTSQERVRMLAVMMTGLQPA